MLSHGVQPLRRLQGALADSSKTGGQELSDFYDLRRMIIVPKFALRSVILLS